MPEKKPSSDIKRALKPRPLGEGEKALWEAVTKDVKSLHPKRTAPSQVSPVSQPKTSPPAKQKSAEVHGWITLEMPLPPVDPLTKPSKSSHQVDAGLKKKVIQGDMPIDGKIDLHGLTLEQAHKKFVTFLSSHIGRGSRFLLVVTGKGAGGEGVIRKSFPHWCADSAHSRKILQVHQAALKHGGSGAFYILLRRAK